MKIFGKKYSEKAATEIRRSKGIRYE